MLCTMEQPSMRPSLRERRRVAAAARVEAAALALFAHHGFDETTVDDIAAAADISRATVFRYFGSKDDIVYAVEPPLLDVMRALVRQQPYVSLGEVVLRYAEHVDEHVPDLRDRAAIIAVTPRLVERFAHVRTRWDLAVARELASRRSPGSPAVIEDHVAAAVAMSALFTAFLHWGTDPSGPLSDVVRRAVRALPDATGSPVRVDR